MMVHALRPPIILIGNTRSGTTITQNLIGLHPEIVTWYEPRTLWMYADPKRRHDEFGESDATENVTRYIRCQFLKYQISNNNRQIMENTPSNVFRVPYVAKIFPDSTYLHITRNPFSCISSIELKWQNTKTWSGVKRSLAVTPVAHLPFYGKQFLRQMVAKKVLRRKYAPIYGPRYDGIEEDLKSLDKLSIIARQWARGNRKARQDLGRLEAGQVLSFRYEDLMQKPETVLPRIYRHCGLNCDGNIIHTAKQMIDPGRQEKWRRLDADALRSVIPEVQDEMRFYGYQVPDTLNCLSG